MSSLGVRSHTEPATGRVRDGETGRRVSVTTARLAGQFELVQELLAQIDRRRRQTEGRFAELARRRHSMASNERRTTGEVHRAEAVTIMARDR